MSDDPNADKFDFSGLGSYTPSGLRMISADNNYLQLARETAARTMIFIVFKEKGEFRLHARNRAFGDFSRALCNESNFVIRAADIGTILRALGYSRARIHKVSSQLNLSRPQARPPVAPPRK